MATIDVSKIEGFDGMTAEQKVEALLGLEVPDKVDLSGYVKKDVFDRTSSELAEAKKTIKSKMTDDEAQQEKWAEMENKIKQLEQEKTESQYKARFLSMPGYDETLAEETAKAMASGDMAKVFEHLQKANAAYEKKLRADIMQNNPRPGGTGGGETPPDEKEKKQSNLDLARSIGKARADAAKSSNDILKLYL